LKFLRRNSQQSLTDQKKEQPTQKRPTNAPETAVKRWLHLISLACPNSARNFALAVQKKRSRTCC